VTEALQAAFQPPTTSESLDKQRIERIVSAIKAEEQRLRRRYPILAHQDAIGFAIFLFSLSGMVLTGVLYYLGTLQAWAAIPLAAIFASISHELEHDLIHRLYFRKNLFVQNLMMLVVWMMRPGTVNPWYRRDIHILHHKVSGTPQDLEERLVGNGIATRLVRFVVMFDGLLGLLVRAPVLNAENKRFNLFEILAASQPFGTLFFAIWYVFLAYHTGIFAAGLLGLYPVIPVWVLQSMQVIDFLVVVLVAPNLLRSFCLNFVTSYMHYYGGVSSLLQQTQVLSPIWLWPMQAFCFNFGSTHGIHHFVVGQPFYIRQMVAKAAHKVMKDNGVRFNDFSTFYNANYYQPTHS
jgi:fatty acid desaturase